MKEGGYGSQLGEFRSQESGETSHFPTPEFCLLPPASFLSSLAQRFDRAEAGGAPCGAEAAGEADDAGEDERSDQIGDADVQGDDIGGEGRGGEGDAAQHDL